MNIKFARQKRIPQIDVLRAIACFLVIVAHSPIPKTANGLIQAIGRGGWVGVDLFFVLSGFLVSGLLFHEFKETGTVRPFRFAARRALKIYPAFYAYLALTTVAIAILANDRSNIAPNKLASEILFVQNYFPSVWGHTWSLAVEEHFYIGIILIVYIPIARMAANPFAYIPYGVIAICVGCLILRVVSGADLNGIPHTTHLRIDALAFGVLISYIWVFKNETFSFYCKNVGPLLFILGSALLLPTFLLDSKVESGLWTYGLCLNYLGSGCILAFLVSRDFSGGIVFNAIAKVGTNSYSIYLWHAVIVNWIVPRFSVSLHSISDHAAWVFAVIASTVLGIIAARVIEFPVLQIRDRWVPRSTANQIN